MNTVTEKEVVPEVEKVVEVEVEEFVEVIETKLKAEESVEIKPKTNVPEKTSGLLTNITTKKTKTFKYDSSTTVQDVIISLVEKLSIKCGKHFSPVCEHSKAMLRNRRTILDSKEPLAKIAVRPGAHNLRCLFRLMFVPRDAFDLLERDQISFEYLYSQCCNDVVQERFSLELKYEIALHLSALQRLQHSIEKQLYA